MSAISTTGPASITHISPTRIPAARTNSPTYKRGRVLRRTTPVRSGPEAGSDVQVTISLRLAGGQAQDRFLRALQDLAAGTGIEASISWPDPTTRVSTVELNGRHPAATAPAAAPAVAASAAAPGQGRIGIRTAPRVVTFGGTPLDLSRLEYELLLFLAEHPARVFTRLQLLDHVWGYTHAGLRTVDVHIRRLRAKFGDDVALVTTVHGVGYRLTDGVNIDIERG
jgi:hypothetical protein